MKLWDKKWICDPEQFAVVNGTFTYDYFLFFPVQTVCLGAISASMW